MLVSVALDVDVRHAEHAIEPVRPVDARKCAA